MKIKQALKKVAQVVVMGTMMFGALSNPTTVEAKTNESVSHVQEKTIATENKVLKVSNDKYGYKIVGKKKSDTVIMAEITDIDKKDKYVTTENVFDETDKIVVDYKDLKGIKKESGTILKITIDGTSANYDEVKKVTLNKDVAEYKGLSVYGQEKYYSDKKYMPNKVTSTLKAFKDSYGFKVVGQKELDTTIVGKITSINKKENYAEIDDMLNGGALTVDLKYIKNISSPKNKIVLATIDGTSANNDRIYKVVTNKNIIKSKHILVLGQNVYYDAYYNDVQ